MTVKRRLQLAYVLMLCFTIGIGSLSIWSVQSWEQTTHALNDVYRQSLRVERLRGDIHRQVKELSDWLTGQDRDAPEEFRHLEIGVQEGLEALATYARHQTEHHSIQALFVTYDKLRALAQTVFTPFPKPDLESDTHALEHELETQLFAELEDRIEALRSYYQSNTARSLDGTVAVGRLTRITAVGIGVLSLIQVGVLLWGIQRWFVKPLAKIQGLTNVISRGRFDQRIDINRHDEMGHLASAIEGMAEKLQQSQARLVQSERLMALGELTSYIAHNMRNPLASIRAAAQVGATETSEKPEALQDIIATVDRLEGWVRNLLVYLKPVRLELEVHDPNRLIHEALTLLQHQMDQRDLHPILKLNPVPPVEMDVSWMEQVLVSILTNAIDASPDGGQLFIASESTEQEVVVSIQDEGEGVSPELHNKLFTPYFTTKPNGVGLGLAMAKKVVVAHGGTIELRRPSHRGTTVKLNLPRRVVIDGNGADC